MPRTKTRPELTQLSRTLKGFLAAAGRHVAGRLAGERCREVMLYRGYGTREVEVIWTRGTDIDEARRPVRKSL